jgi:hypothetical protein
MVRFRSTISRTCSCNSDRLDSKEVKCTAENPFGGETHAAPAAPAVTHEHYHPLPRAASSAPARAPHPLAIRAAATAAASCAGL